MRDRNFLKSQLEKLDNVSYKAYKELQGEYQFNKFTLAIDRVQGDPFAAPSRMRVIIPQEVERFPQQLYKNKSREIASRDYIARQFARIAKQYSRDRGSGKSGLIAISSLGQEVLERSTVLIDYKRLEVRFVVGLPARGRRILGRQSISMLCEDIPQIVNNLLYSSLDTDSLQSQIETVEDADWLRQQLPQQDLVAFIANGAILPRRSGVDPRPLLNGLTFQSPETLEVEFICPNRGLIRGMGVPTGINLIVGGGYHGKSTLLKAIELGIYNHIPGDGREYVVTDIQAAKIRAEDGRGITGVDISPFINHLPQERSTTKFDTANASGSTSQAANIIEALEAGAEVLLIDEDTSATNFTIRDRRMQALVSKDKEPITPFIDKVRQLYEDYGVSTILVMGGSGDYFEVADRIVAMDSYQPQDVTAKAKEIALQYATARNTEGGTVFGKINRRVLQLDRLDFSRGRREFKVSSRGVVTITVGSEDIDLSAVEQFVDPGQLNAIALTLIYLKKRCSSQQLSMAEILSDVQNAIARNGLDTVTNEVRGDLAQFRSLDLAAALNRLRSLKVTRTP